MCNALKQLGIDYLPALGRVGAGCLAIASALCDSLSALKVSGAIQAPYSGGVLDRSIKGNLMLLTQRLKFGGHPLIQRIGHLTPISVVDDIGPEDRVSPITRVPQHRHREPQAPQSTDNTTPNK